MIRTSLAKKLPENTRISISRRPSWWETPTRLCLTCCCWTWPRSPWASKQLVAWWRHSSSGTPPFPPSRPRHSPPTATTSLPSPSRFFLVLISKFFVFVKFTKVFHPFCCTSVLVNSKDETYHFYELYEYFLSRRCTTPLSSSFFVLYEYF